MHAATKERRRQRDVARRLNAARRSVMRRHAARQSAPMRNVQAATRRHSAIRRQTAVKVTAARSATAQPLIAARNNPGRNMLEEISLMRTISLFLCLHLHKSDYIWRHRR